MTTSSESHKDHYKNAGVDVAAGEEVVSWLQSGSDASQSKYGQVVSGIGGFASIFRPNLKGIDDPVLVSATDGVGTKIALAQKYQQLGGIGIDLVAMCVNDLYCIGARPLFFLDYYLTEKLDRDAFKVVLSSIKAGLAQCETVLIGGETAEHPGHFPKGQFDLAGFVVGIADHSKLVSGHDRVAEGDAIFGFASSGFHSNGFSLIRSWLDQRPDLIDETLIDLLLAPTRIYSFIPELLARLPDKAVHAIAHVTGGGISGNLPRVMPKGLNARIDWRKVPTPEWMAQFISAFEPRIANLENTFNMGVGLTVFVGAADVETFVNTCRGMGVEPFAIGSVVANGGGDACVEFVGVN